MDKDQEAMLRMCDIMLSRFFAEGEEYLVVAVLFMMEAISLRRIDDAEAILNLIKKYAKEHNICQADDYGELNSEVID